jgi:hypothetical protein
MSTDFFLLFLILSPYALSVRAVRRTSSRPSLSPHKATSQRKGIRMKQGASLSLSYLHSDPGCYRRVPFRSHTPTTMGKSGQTPSISFTGVLALPVRGPKVRDSGDVVTQEQPLAIFDTHAPMYATLLSVRPHPHKNGGHEVCQLLPGLYHANQ